jgi:hypothetical protein
LGIQPQETGDAAIDKPKKVTVMLDPEVAAAFSAPGAINETLRMVNDISQLIKPKQ